MPLRKGRVNHSASIYKESRKWQVTAFRQSCTGIDNITWCFMGTNPKCKIIVIQGHERFRYLHWESRGGKDNDYKIILTIYEPSIWPTLYIYYLQQETWGRRTFIIPTVQEISPENLHDGWKATQLIRSRIGTWTPFWLDFPACPLSAVCYCLSHSALRLRC